MISGPAVPPPAARPGHEEQLAYALGVARQISERATQVRGALLHELEAVMHEVEATAAELRRVGDALSAGFARLATTASLPSRRALRSSEDTLLDTVEPLAAAVEALAGVQADVIMGVREQLGKRQELRRSFRRLPELNARLERTCAQLERSFRWSAASAVGGRLTFSGRVVAGLVESRRLLEVLGHQLEGLPEPLERAARELGFFACRGTAASVGNGPRRRGIREIQLRADPDGELMLVWNQYDTTRLRVYPAHGTELRACRAQWTLCFTLPRGDADGRDLRIVHPAVAVWSAPGTARLVHAGVLAWEQPLILSRRP